MSNSIIKIFLAEDDEDDRDFFHAALGSVASNAEVIHAANGEQAIQFFKKAEALPDLVFLDINMPKADGIECLRHIKHLHPGAALPVIMLSTASSPKVIEQSFALGASAYIEKPSHFNHLIKFIEYCLTDLRTAPTDAEFVLNRRLRNLQML